MPSFIGSLTDAARAGQFSAACENCGAWTWTTAGDRLWCRQQHGRLICSRSECAANIRTRLYAADGVALVDATVREALDAARIEAVVGMLTEIDPSGTWTEEECEVALRAHAVDLVVTGLRDEVLTVDAVRRMLGGAL